MEEQKDEHAHHAPKKDETYTFSKTTIWQIVSAVLGIALVISLFTGGFGITGKDTPTPTPTIGNPTPDAPEQPIEVDLDDDAAFGDEDAPVTIVEFSDYQCPFCSRFYQQTLPQLKKDYIDTGKVRIVYRDFPLSFHSNAHISAEAAECARDQGDDETYFKYHDKLFGSQDEWSSATNNDILVRYAKDFGLNEDKFKDCLTSGKFKKEVDDDFTYGSQVGVSGTPTFFVNGVRLVGAQPYEAFKVVIDGQLS